MQILIKANCEITGKKNIPFYYKDTVKLINYTTTKTEAKKNISRIPLENPIVIN